MHLLIMRLLCCLLLVPVAAFAHHVEDSGEPLPMIGQAPEFTLIREDGSEFSLAELRGKVVVISFMFTRCPDICPILNTKLLKMQKELGSAFGREVFFVSITLDPEYDTPDVLKAYAEALGYDPAGWAFLTGAPKAVLMAVRNYGVFHQKQMGGNIDHNALSSILDREGNIRLQYMGSRFDVQEFLHDLHSLIDEEPVR